MDIKEHIAKADDAIGRAENAAQHGLAVASSWALIAQAHLAAANVKDLLGLGHGLEAVAVPNDTEVR